MQVAARWLGLGSHVVGALAGVVLAVSLWPGPLERLTRADVHLAPASQPTAARSTEAELLFGH
jgi:hypothetical protein